MLYSFLCMCIRKIIPTKLHAYIDFKKEYIKISHTSTTHSCSIFLNIDLNIPCDVV